VSTGRILQLDVQQSHALVVMYIVNMTRSERVWKRSESKKKSVNTGVAPALSRVWQVASIIDSALSQGERYVYVYIHVDYIQCTRDVVRFCIVRVRFSAGCSGGAPGH
jgi:hypothetical protein